MPRSPRLVPPVTQLLATVLNQVLALLLAAALRDNCRASVVGGTTYGKGLIQGVFGLSDGGALIETVASYSTPAGDEINKRGVVPDVQKTFVSDVLGSSFVDQDIKAASFGTIRKRACVMPDKPPPRRSSSASPLQGE